MINWRVVAGAALAALVALPALSQGFAGVGAQVRDRYQECVTNAAVGLYPSIGQKALAVEQGFQACLTEEQAMLSILRAMSKDPVFVQTSWVGFKMKLKQSIISILR